MSAPTTPQASDTGKRKDGPAPAATGFDLLDGAFVKVAHARLMRLVVTGLALVAVAFIAVQTLMLRVEAADLTSQRSQAETQLAQLKDQVAQEANTGGLTRQQMQTHLDTLGHDAALVAYNDLALNQIIGELDLRTPASVDITRIELRPTVEAGVITYTLTMTATAPGYDTAFAYRDTLTASPFFEDLSLTWAGSADQLSLTITATVADHLETDRSRQFRELFAPDFDPFSPPDVNGDDGDDDGDDDDGGED